VDVILNLKNKLKHLLKSCDVPASDTFSFALSLGLKRRDKQLTSIVTKAALNAAKAKGKQLGNVHNLTAEGRILGLKKIRENITDNHQRHKIGAVISRCREADM
jgi:hypothetical protein